MSNSRSHNMSVLLSHSLEELVTLINPYSNPNYPYDTEKYLRETSFLTCPQIDIEE